MVDCILNNQSVTVMPPLLQQGAVPSCGTDPTADARCLDPQFAADNPGTCSNSAPLTSLSVIPGTGEIDVAGKFGYRAIAHYGNGLTKDVTDDAAWNTSNAAIAAVFSPGLISGVGAGTTTVTATFRSLPAAATIQVDTQCIMDGLDVVLVLDRSASMNGIDTGDLLTRLDKAKEACKAMVSNVQLSDQVAVVSFGGIIQENADGSLTKIPDAAINSFLNSDKGVADTALDNVATNSPCVVGQNLNCASGIGSGLALAVQELGSVRARTGAVKKVIVLLTDGVENICNPDPTVTAAAAKAAGILIIVVALEVPDEGFFDCTSNFVSSHAFLSGLCSSGMVYFEDDTGGLQTVLSRIPNIICTGGYGYGGYYYRVPLHTHYFDALDYTGFINWVVSGHVDLVGRDLWVFFPPTPARGAYVDMAGTNTGGNNSSSLLSKDIFGSTSGFSWDVLPGNYRLSLDVAGNQRVDPGAVGLSLKVRLGGIVNGVPNSTAFETIITVTDYKQPFKNYQFDFNLSTACSLNLTITQQPLPPGFPTQVGLLIDNVLFANMDSATTLLFDNFNAENPAP